MTSDKTMVEEMARAIDAAAGFNIPRDEAVSYAQACAAVTAKRIEELERENLNLRQQLMPYLKHEEAINAARRQMRAELAEERKEKQK